MIIDKYKLKHEKKTPIGPSDLNGFNNDKINEIECIRHFYLFNKQ